MSFPQGTCDLAAEGNVLTIACTAGEPALEPLLVKIVEVHLERFAWRENLSLDWQRDGISATDLMTKLRAMPDPHGARTGRGERD